MAVIINDFEIAVEAEEPPAPGGATGSAEEEAPPARPPMPEEIVAVLRWHDERMSRVEAT